MKTKKYLYNKDRSENVINFIGEVIQLSKKYNLSITHEDFHGGFEITPYDEAFSDWLKQASELNYE
jgi:hypothetical protein